MTLSRLLKIRGPHSNAEQMPALVFMILFSISSLPFASPSSLVQVRRAFWRTKFTRARYKLRRCDSWDRVCAIYRGDPTLLSRRETVKRRKTHTPGAVLRLSLLFLFYMSLFLSPSLSLFLCLSVFSYFSLSLSTSSPTPYADRSTGFHPCIVRKSTGKSASTKFPGLGPREKFNMRLFFVARLIPRARESELMRASGKVTPGVEMMIR